MEIAALTESHLGTWTNHRSLGLSRSLRMYPTPYPVRHTGTVEGKKNMFPRFRSTPLTPLKALATATRWRGGVHVTRPPLLFTLLHIFLLAASGDHKSMFALNRTNCILSPTSRESISGIGDTYRSRLVGLPVTRLSARYKPPSQISLFWVQLVLKYHKRQLRG